MVPVSLGWTSGGRQLWQRGGAAAASAVGPVSSVEKVVGCGEAGESKTPERESFEKPPSLKPQLEDWLYLGSARSWSSCSTSGDRDPDGGLDIRCGRPIVEYRTTFPFCGRSRIDSLCEIGLIYLPQIDSVS